MVENKLNGAKKNPLTVHSKLSSGNDLGLTVLGRGAQEQAKSRASKSGGAR